MSTSRPAAPRLSKSRFVTGWQCAKLLWWTVHEPGARELEPTIVLRDRLAQGRQVTLLARERFPGGVLIDDSWGDDLRQEATWNAIESGTPAVFEATFVRDDVFVSVDVLQREADGWALVEVKSATKVKDEHIPDAAVQLHVLRAAGLPVHRVEIMHLNPDFRHPADGELFARTDVTARVETWLAAVPTVLADLRAALQGPLPEVGVGLHCWKPRDCPFFERCWPEDRDHVRRLYRARKTDTIARMQQGLRTIHDIPTTEEFSAVQQRQLAATRAETLIVESGLQEALAPLDRERLGYLDFETINRAVPVWDGLKPWQQIAVQYSYHERRPDGSVQHDAFLAEGPDDPRAEIADRLLAATATAEQILMYSPFERTRIKELAQQVPMRAAELSALADKMVDLLPIVRRYVYHPDFKGSFSIKAILQPLVPSLAYDDLIIVDGLTASVEIARLLFFSHLVQDRDALRDDLLRYCERDTWAMVKLLERLRELA